MLCLSSGTLSAVKRRAHRSAGKKTREESWEGLSLEEGSMKNPTMKRIEQLTAPGGAIRTALLQGFAS